jgi:hypothetical protein
MHSVRPKELVLRTKVVNKYKNIHQEMRSVITKEIGHL